VDKPTIPCSVVWCDSASHVLDSGGYHHLASVATFTGTDGSDLEILLAQVEMVTGPSLPPHIIVRRSIGSLSGQFDFISGEAQLLAELLVAIDPTEVVRVAAALGTAAAVLADEYEEDGQ
jgi:hypothetical protein